MGPRGECGCVSPSFYAGREAAEQNTLRIVATAVEALKAIAGGCVDGPLGDEVNAVINSDSFSSREAHQAAFREKMISWMQDRARRAIATIEGGAQ